jgi:hypothetical protein
VEGCSPLLWLHPSDPRIPPPHVPRRAPAGCLSKRRRPPPAEQRSTRRKAPPVRRHATSNSRRRWLSEGSRTGAPWLVNLRARPFGASWGRELTRARSPAHRTPPGDTVGAGATKRRGESTATAPSVHPHARGPELLPASRRSARSFWASRAAAPTPPKTQGQPVDRRTCEATRRHRAPARLPQEPFR